MVGEAVVLPQCPRLGPWSVDRSSRHRGFIEKWRVAMFETHRCALPRQAWVGIMGKQHGSFLQNQPCALSVCHEQLDQAGEKCELKRTRASWTETTISELQRLRLGLEWLQHRTTATFAALGMTYCSNNWWARRILDTA